MASKQVWGVRLAVLLFAVEVLVGTVGLIMHLWLFGLLLIGSAVSLATLLKVTRRQRGQL